VPARTINDTTGYRPQPNQSLAHWQIHANKRLLKLIAQHAQQRPHPWGSCPAHQAEAARIAAAAKNDFAHELAGMSELPHPEIVEAFWRQTVDTLEADIRAYRAQSSSTTP